MSETTIGSKAIESPALVPKPRQRLALPEGIALVVFLILELVYFSIASPYFLNYDNFVNILNQLSITGVLAAGATILLIGGQFDLSVGSGVGWAGLVLTLAAPVVGIGSAVLLAIIAALLMGVINGLLVTRVKVNAFIATLGTMAIFRGLTLAIGQGQNLPVKGFDWAIATPFLSIPATVLVFIGVVIVVGIVLRFTVYGRSIYAIGANDKAARLVGIRNRQQIFIAFLISGACIAIAALLSTSQLGSTSGTTGTGLEIAALTAVILGGTTLAGGSGSVSGTVIGLLIVGVLGNGLTLLNIDSSWQQAASGGLLILAVSFDQLRQRLERRS